MRTTLYTLPLLGEYPGGTHTHTDSWTLEIGPRKSVFSAPLESRLNEVFHAGSSSWPGRTGSRASRLGGLWRTGWTGPESIEGSSKSSTSPHVSTYPRCLLICRPIVLTPQTMAVTMARTE